ncbi:MAG: hypothetical protein JWR05_3546 [Mucilaginibacter sp.]|nr:hypothetical protein [Mucilaginibacter sp.]
MAKQFIYAPINPIWMNPVVSFNPEYNTLPFDYQQPQVTYGQKVKFGIPTRLQVLSDWVPTLKIYDLFTTRLIDSIGPSTPANGIIGQTFTVYEFLITWSAYPAGNYYIEISYTDDTETLQITRSGLIQSAANWPGTLVFEYNNSYNAFSAIFSTGIIFTMIVEGNIADYSPAFQDVIYDDQNLNTTKLNSIPFRQFNLYVASTRGTPGIPLWMGDKMNWIFACDQIKIDGVYYQNTNGSKWEVKRPDALSPNFIGLVLAIKEADNLFLNQYQAGQLPAGSIQVITQTKSFLGISADITMAGIFKDYSLLTRIIIYNLGGNVFILNAGTAIDGSAPITSSFTTSGRLKEIWNIDELFDVPATLYIQGLAGTNCNIVVEWDQLDAPSIAPIVNTKKFAKNTLYSYEEVTIGDFEIDWNIGTGTGNAGTDYEGCVISGTNGTLDRNGLLEIGWNPTLPLTRDTLVGNAGNTIVQTPGQVGEHAHLMFNGDTSGTDLTGTSPVAFQKNSNIKRDYIMSQSGSLPDRGTTSIINPLGPEPMDISNRARVTLKFVCITN